MWQVNFWITFLSLCFCAGYLLPLFAISLRAHQQRRAAVLGVLCVALAVSCWERWIHTGLRPQMVLIVFSSFLLSIVVCWKKFPAKEKLQNIIFIWSVFVGIVVGGKAILRVVTPFGMRNLSEEKAISPDGRYEASLIYRDGLTFGYYFVSVKHTSFSLNHIFDYPYVRVAEVAAEGLTEVKWGNKDTLFIVYDKEAEFAQQDKSWKDVRIVYRKKIELPGN